jgi:hypothetical protein
MRDGAECTLTLRMSQMEVRETLSHGSISYDFGEVRRYLLPAGSSQPEYSLHFSATGSEEEFYDGEGILDGIEVYSDLISADKGFQVGDDMSTAEKICGPADIVNESLCEYFFDGYVLRFSWKESKISSWYIGIDTKDERLTLRDDKGKPVYVSLGVEIEEVERLLSETGLTVQEQKSIKSNITSWSVDGFTLYFGTYAEYRESVLPPKFRFFEYKVDTLDYPTGKGIRVGDTVEKLMEVYGAPKEILENDEVKEYEYVLIPGWREDFNMNLVFAVESKKVTNWYVTIADQVLEYDISN